MSSVILRTDKMARGAFDGGNIMEYKPIGFPHEPGGLRPVSTLFYWAYAWSENGGLIAEHPHQAFEILSFVLSGEIEHYDSSLNDWLTLKAGDVQIIRSGSGISHAERMGPGSSMFQIWFDPYVQEAVRNPATYTDYNASEFQPAPVKDGYHVTSYRNGNGPIEMKSPANIERIDLKSGTHSLDIEGSEVQLFYVMDGHIRTKDGSLSKNELIISDTLVECEVVESASLFRIRLPAQPPYPLYHQSMS